MSLFDDDDLEPLAPGCFSPGMPDPERAELEDPLTDSDK